MAESPEVKQTIVTLEEAKKAMRVLHESEDVDLAFRLSAATELVLLYVAQHRMNNEAWQTEVATWDQNTAPDVVKASILYLFGDTVGFRGDGQNPPEGGSPLLPGRVRMWLDLLRDPTVA